jgi:hypothetical protein
MNLGLWHAARSLSKFSSEGALSRPAPVSEIQNFADSLSNSCARRAFHSSTNTEHVPGQVWLAVAGLALVALAIYSIVGN